MKPVMNKVGLLCFLLMVGQMAKSQQTSESQVSSNGMTVTWYYQNERVYFEMTAPTTGWVTVGFSTTTGITGAYLVMGRIVNNVPEVVEHYTHSPGNYQSLEALGAQPQVMDVGGTQTTNTKIQFSLPLKAKSKYQKNLQPNKEYVMILAYSRSDDFQHHSVMRTSLNVTL